MAFVRVKDCSVVGYCVFLWWCVFYGWVAKICFVSWDGRRVVWMICLSCVFLSWFVLCVCVVLRCI